MLHRSSFEVVSSGVKVTLFAADWVICDLVADPLVPVVVEVDALVPVVVEVTVSKEDNSGDST